MEKESHTVDIRISFLFSPTTFFFSFTEVLKSDPVVSSLPRVNPLDSPLKWSKMLFLWAFSFIDGWRRGTQREKNIRLGCARRICKGLRHSQILFMGDRFRLWSIQPWPLNPLPLGFSDGTRRLAMSVSHCYLAVLQKQRISSWRYRSFLGIPRPQKQYLHRVFASQIREGALKLYMIQICRRQPSGWSTPPQPRLCYVMLRNVTPFIIASYTDYAKDHLKENLEFYNSLDLGQLRQLLPTYLTLYGWVVWNTEFHWPGSLGRIMN